MQITKNDLKEENQLMLKFSLTANQFDKAAKLTKMKETGKEIARLIIVGDNNNKLTPAEAARKFNKSKPYVAECVKRIMKSFLISKGIPDDWEYVCLTLPKNKADEIKKVEKFELEKLFKNKGVNI